MRSGFVSLIGRPNVGKSTLLNALINEHVAIISDKAGTTRNIIQGIYNEEGVQIVFVDTPGIHKPKSKLGKILNKQSYALMQEVDAVLFIVDASSPFGPTDQSILNALKNTTSPVLLILNKIDKIEDKMLIKVIDNYKDLFPFADIVPVSGLKKDNLNVLVKVIKKYLRDDVKYFDEELYTSNSVSFMISDFVREKIRNSTIEEVPHSITCVTTKYEEQETLVKVMVDIIVDRDSIKKIVIGKKGERLKMVGTEARKDIEKLLGKKVYLELYVKTIKKWREKEKMLQELGFNEFE